MQIRVVGEGPHAEEEKIVNESDQGAEYDRSQPGYQTNHQRQNGQPKRRLICSPGPRHRSTVRRQHLSRISAVVGESLQKHGTGALCSQDREPRGNLAMSCRRVALNRANPKVKGTPQRRLLIPRNATIPSRDRSSSFIVRRRLLTHRACLWHYFMRWLRPDAALGRRSH